MRLLAILLLVLPPVVLAQQTLWQTNGLTTGDRFGRAAAPVGDVNLDGFTDVVVGATLADPNGIVDAGQATVLSGFDGSVLFTFNGTGAGDQFGYAVSGAGDVDGDTIPDIIVGAWQHDPNGISNAGQATVFSGLTGGIIHTFSGTAPNEVLGFSVGGAGDVNSDGYDDVTVGAPGTTNGTATVFSGYDGSVIYTFNGTGNNNQFGYCVPSAGDVDGDGYQDIVVGARYAAGAGQATVFSGQTGNVIWTFTGLVGGDNFGTQCCGAGDVDGDGYDDVVVGAILADPNGITDAGQAIVYSGATGSILHVFNGDTAGDWMGWPVTGAGDVDGDGFSDLLVGAPAPTPWANPARPGRAFVFSGLNGSVICSFTGATTNDLFGYCLSPGSDISGDGFADIYVGAARADPGGVVDAGQVTALTPLRAWMTPLAPPVVGTTIGVACNSPYTPGALFLSAFATAPRPGIPISSTQVVPLQADFLFYTSLYPNPYFLNTSGTLGPSGTATVTVAIPPIPALAGVTVWGAFVTLAPLAPSGVGTISAALPLPLQ